MTGMGGGAVVLWSGLEPRLHAVPIAPGGCVFGRELLESRGMVVSDATLSQRHVRIDRVRGGFVVEDLGSCNGTFADGDRASSRVYAPGTILRVGRTIAALVDNLEHYDRASVDLVNGLVVGPTSRRLQERIAASRNVALVGVPGSGRRTLAMASTRGDRRPFAIYDPRKDSLARVAARDPATIIIPELHRLQPLDRSTLQCLLDRSNGPKIIATDEAHHVDPELRLATLAIPGAAERLDELPMVLHHAVRSVSPLISIHAGAVERMLIDRWPARFLDATVDIARTAKQVAARGGTVVRHENLAAYHRRDHCIVARSGEDTLN
jgi:pSer/pThr/pTyr-binding forkhead associated (FHA) protein